MIDSNQFRIAVTRNSCIWMSKHDIKNLKKLIFFVWKLHLLNLTYKSYLRNFFKIIFICAIYSRMNLFSLSYSRSSSMYVRMSFMYARMNISRYSWSVLLMYVWKLAKAFINSKNITLYWKCSNRHRNVVFHSFFFSNSNFVKHVSNIELDEHFCFEKSIHACVDQRKKIYSWLLSHLDRDNQHTILILCWAF